MAAFTGLTKDEVQADHVTATLWGIYIHAALSERVGKLGFLAREVADELPHHLDV